MAVALHSPVYIIILSLSALLAPRCKLTSSEVFVNTHTHSSRRKCKNTYFPPHPPLTRANYSNDNQCTTERPRLKLGNFAIFSRAKQFGKSMMQKSSSNSGPKIVPEKPKMECCGQYPYRHPYKPEDGQRACCGNKTYSTRLLTCCAPNVLRAVCE